MATLPETTVRRLILVRQMYLHGAQRAADPTEIGRVIAVQTIDYAVETLLKTIVSHFGPPSDYYPPQRGYYGTIPSLQNQRYSPKMDFYRLWDEALAIFRDPEKGIEVTELPLRREMDLLHTMRNDVQHNGIVPASGEVRKFSAYAESFLRDVSLDAFGQGVDEITLASLIENAEIKTLIREAEIALEEDLYGDSIVAATKAFELAALQDRRDRPYRRRLPFWIGRDVERIADLIEVDRAFQQLAHTLAGQDYRIRRDLESAGKYLKFDKAFKELGELFKMLKQEFESLQEGLDVIALGGDLRQYKRFRQLSPHVVMVIDGDMMVSTSRDWQPTKEEAIEVLSFVFDTILHWQTSPLVAWLTNS
jgi:hypothetical protein